MRRKRIAGLAILATLSTWAALSPLPAVAASYTGVWMGSTYSLTLVPNVTVEGLPDAFLVGTITNFQTSDPTYSCLNTKTINVFLAPHEFPSKYVVHDGLQRAMCAYGTWTFSNKYAYTGTWNGKNYALTVVPNVTVEGLPDASLITNSSTGAPVQITNFQTTDPAYKCLAGKGINVFMAQSEFPNQHVAHDGWQRAMCTYGVWLFMPVSHYTITVESFIPQAQLWDPDTSVVCSLLIYGSLLALGINSCPYPTYTSENAVFGSSSSNPGAVNCYTPFDPFDTNVTGVFTGDGHAGFSGSVRTQTTIDFDWNPASRTISNFITSAQHGVSTVTLSYYWFGILLAQCSVSSTQGLQYPVSSTVSSASFTTGTSGYDPFVPGETNPNNCLLFPYCGPYGNVIDATLRGSFNANGTLTLNWVTDWYPSFGVQAWPNKSYNAPQYQQTVLDESGVNTMSLTGISYVGFGLKYYNALTGACTPTPDPTGLIISYNYCNAGGTFLYPAP